MHPIRNPEPAEFRIAFGELDDQRNMYCFLKSAFAVKQVIVFHEFFAMIGHQDDHRLVVNPHLFQPADVSSENIVKLNDFSVV